MGTKVSPKSLTKFYTNKGVCPESYIWGGNLLIINTLQKSTTVSNKISQKINDFGHFRMTHFKASILDDLMSSDTPYPLLIENAAESL